MELVSRCVKGIFNGICRGEIYIEELLWMKWIYVMKNVCFEIVEYVFNYIYICFFKFFFKCD